MEKDQIWIYLLQHFLKNDFLKVNYQSTVKEGNRSYVNAFFKQFL